MTKDEIREKLLCGLKPTQADAVQSTDKHVLVVAGAGSGKTEVMARRIAWWVGIEDIPKDSIVAFTFTDKAAEEMKFRVRRWIGEITTPGENVNLRGMYVGTIHGYCLAKIREYWPDTYHNYDILDEASRAALILREFYGLLSLQGLRSALGNASQSTTVDQFITAYDQLHEHNLFDINLPDQNPPFQLGTAEREWCTNAQLLTDVGNDEPSTAFAISAARYYAYLRCRRFLDFSTSQTEFLQSLVSDGELLELLAAQHLHIVVDEVQDINPVQRDIIRVLSNNNGKLTAVGDHRQSIYGFRGAKVELIGNMWNEFNDSQDARVVDLEHNFRSTPRIIDIANKWARTITPAGGMQTPPMIHGKEDRIDAHPSHVAMIKFNERRDEAAWIAEAIRALVPSEQEGAEHDQRDGTFRGLALSDIAILVRSSTDVRTYMQALEEAGIPSIVRAGPDLFSQPEVLLMLGALSISADIHEFFGSPYSPKSLPKRIDDVLGCHPNPEPVIRASADMLRSAGLNFTSTQEEQLIFAAEALNQRINNDHVWNRNDIENLRSKGLRDFLTRNQPLRRVFPQQLYHWLLTEAGIEHWDSGSSRGETAMFHLGTFSKLVTGLETPGWTSASDYKWQIIGLCQYGSEGGRAPEQPLIVQPDAVSISTIHGAKGLEFAAIFLADVCARRLPSSRARRSVDVPLSGEILNDIDIEGLSDNENYDGERRLMYVALTRAERFLVVSGSGNQNSRFFRELQGMIGRSGGIVTDDSASLLEEIRHAPLEYNREFQLATSFSDLRYYLGCPHDFYLRKVMGFAPTIDQAFGYGRGVHNLMRAVHTDPESWAALSSQRENLEAALTELIDHGLFYLRYTTGEPAENMRRKGVRVVCDYIEYFTDELQNLTFEPEKEFETVIEYDDGEGSAMISGAIDIIRCDDPPRVTLIDFKSGSPESYSSQQLDEDEMRLQVGIYAVAAQKELEYEPEQGMVRYLDVNREFGENHELSIPLDPDSIETARQTVVETATAIRDRQFVSGPVKPGFDGRLRCSSCDFLGFCGMDDAITFKTNSPQNL